MTSEYHPGPNPAAETARRAWLEARAAAARQLEAMGGIPEIGTDAGERYAALERDTAHAYKLYLDTWDAAYPPKADPEADARAAGDYEFCNRHAGNGHAPIWDADGPYCQTCWEVTPRNQVPAPAAEPEPEPELEAG